jgi:hypothetical protein
MTHLWEYDSRRIDGVNTPQQMSDLKFITDNEICFVLAPADVTFEDIKEIRKITLS